MKRILEFTDPNVPEEDKKEFNFGDITIYVPEITERNIDRVIESVVHNTKDYFENNEIVKPKRTLEKVNERWARKKEDSDITEYLSQVTSYPKSFIRDFGFIPFECFSNLEGFENISREIEERLTKRNYRDFFDVDSEGYLRGCGKLKLKKYEKPEAVVHILSGNVFGYTALPLAIGLQGFPQIVKVSSEEPLSILLYASDVMEEDPEFRRTFVVGYWKGGNVDVEEKIYSRKVFINVMGSDKTIRNIKEKIKHGKARMVGHGHKIGIALIEEDMLTEETAYRIASDVALWDGFACFNVKNIFVPEKRKKNVRNFAFLLNEKLQEFVERYPSTYLEKNKELQKLLFLYSMKDDVFCSIERGYFVRISDNFEVPTTLCRGVNIIPFSDKKKVAKELKRYYDHLQTAIVATKNGRNLLETSYLLSEAGVTNIHLPGNAHYISPWEPHDGVYDAMLAHGIEDGLRWIAVNLNDAFR